MFVLEFAGNEGGVYGRKRVRVILRFNYRCNPMLSVTSPQRNIAALRSVDTKSAKLHFSHRIDQSHNRKHSGF